MIQEQQVEIASGLLQEAGGQFDLALDTEVSRSLFRNPLSETNRLRIDPFNRFFLDPKTTSVRDQTDVRIGLKKQFRFGPTVSPGVSVNRVTDNLDQRRAVNRADINFLVTIPLLKGFGRQDTGALEMAARYQHEASALGLRHTISLQILNTTSAYWNCLATQEQLEILEDTKNRASELIQGIRELVEAKLFPGAELKQVQADRAEKTAAFIAGEQRLLQARQNLGLAMGLSFEELPQTPLPTDTFPSPPIDATASLISAQPLIGQALNRRSDYQAAHKQQKAAKVFSVAARKNLKPRLDLNFQVGYAGLTEGSRFSQAYDALDPNNLTGLNMFGVLRLEWPFANNAARGLLLQREAAHQQSGIEFQNLARQISSGILVAHGELARSIEELKKVKEASDLFGQAVENERAKLQLGTSTTIDLITTENRHSNALLNEIATKARYSIALVRLRFEAGLLLEASDSQKGTVSSKDLITIPRSDPFESTIESSNLRNSEEHR